MYMRGQRKVHAVEAARAQQFGFAAAEFHALLLQRLPRADGDIFLGGNGKKRHAARKRLGHPGRAQRQRGAHQRGELRIVPAGMATPFSGFAAGCAGQRMPSSSPMTAAQGPGRAALQNGLYACAGQTGLRRKPAAAQQFGHTAAVRVSKKPGSACAPISCAKAKQRFTLGVNGGKDLLFNSIHGFEPPQYGNKGRQKTAPFPGVFLSGARAGDIQTRFIGRRPCGTLSTLWCGLPWLRRKYSGSFPCCQR